MFKRNTDDCKLSTIILRGSTKNILEDVERAIDDGVNVFRSIVREKEFCPGAGSTEIVHFILIHRFCQANWKPKPKN